MNGIEGIQSILEFYRALGIERLPFSRKEDALGALMRSIGNCRRCGLHSGRTNVVFGEGDADARLMFIGEAPGKDEDAQGRPFVGEAGKLLTSLIEKLGFKRKEVYIGNMAKCRPPQNRDPEDDEIAACMPFIKEQIRIIDPDVIMTLGRIASHALTGLDTPISKLRGRFCDLDGIPLMPTFHPAYLLRNKADKLLVWADALEAVKLIGRRR